MYVRNLNDLRELVIGSISYVSPTEFRVMLDLYAPQNTAINTGVPTLFPKINGFVLIPNEIGAIVGIISWLGIENSPYPKRKGFKDFDLIDLPFPQRIMSVNPVGVLKNKRDNTYQIERGVYSYPSIGDAVTMPTQQQLTSIIENKDINAKVHIGNAPIASNSKVMVDPNKLFGRHIAVLGNTGSGKSCTVAGLIRWSLDAAKEESNKDQVNARFIILDPNGEYNSTFDDKGNTKIRKFKVDLSTEENEDFNQLKVPAWMWDSYEWSSILQASGKTQRPLLRRALREIKSGAELGTDEIQKLRVYFSSLLVSIRNDLGLGAKAFIEKSGRSEFGRKLQMINEEITFFLDKFKLTEEQIEELQGLQDSIGDIISSRLKSFQKDNETIEYFTSFSWGDVEFIAEEMQKFIDSIGGLISYEGPNEDTPIPFKSENLPNHLETLAQEQNAQQYLDFLIMRLRTMFTDSRMASIINPTEHISLKEWLDLYIGEDNAETGEVAILDLSLVPTDVIHLVVAVISRLIFEALQRYRRLHKKELPTVLVLEEAHTFVSRYNKENDDLTSNIMCCQTFEKIAREGRKFGLGLMLSSQRPSELSPTVLSQCNTFLLHRLVNDRDQELVRRLVPDNLEGLLNELPVLPTRKAILLGWAAPIPLLVDIRNLPKEHRPQSDDPKYWEVWTGKEKREVDWKRIADEWQQKTNNVNRI